MSKRNVTSMMVAAALYNWTPQVAAQVAQQADKESGWGLEEVIVTAQKRAESINDVPMSIAAISGDALQSMGVTDTASLARLVPGLSYTDSSYGTPVYYIRGIGFFDTSLAAKPAVTVYVDEVPLAFPALTLGAVFDLERVEVLKGPQGTLFGQNSTGGAINYIAAKPTDSFAAGFDAGVGNFSSYEASGFVSGPLSETLRYRVAMKHSGSSDWQRSVTRDDEMGGRNFTQARVLLDWQPLDQLRIGVNLNGFIDKSDVQSPQFVGSFQQTATAFVDPRLLTYPLANDNARQADWGDDDFAYERDNHLWQSTLRVDYDWTDRVTLTSLTSYAKFAEDFGIDVDGTITDAANFHIVGDVESFNQELRLAGTYGHGDWVFGINYAKDDANELDTQFTSDASSGHSFDRLGIPPIDQVPQVGNTTFESKAVFGNIKFGLTDTLSLQAGARHTQTDIDFEGCTLNAGNGSYARGFSAIQRTQGFTGTIAPGDCVTFLTPTQPGLFVDSKSESNTSWRIGLDWTHDWGLLYGNVSRGYKAGSYPTLPGTTPAQYRPVDQEKVTSYEVGFKLTAADRALQLNGAVFYGDYVDKQLKGRTIVPIFGALESLVNIPKSEVRGAELDVTWLPLSGLRLNAGVTYLETEVTEGDPLGNYTVLGGSVRSNIEGERFPYTPKWQVNAGAEYEFTLTDSLNAVAGTNLSYRSETNGDFLPDPRLDVDAYTLVDVRVGVVTPDEQWRVMVYGRNITDEYYWTTATRRTDSIVRFAGMPRTYGLNLSYRF